MTNLTMADVVEYFSAYKAKHNEDCTLSIDAIEMILDGTEDDDTDLIVASMYEAQHTDEATEEDDRSVAMPVETDTSEGSAYAYANKMDPEMGQHLEVLAEAALQNKRGGAVIMFDLHRLYSADIVNTVWPEPGSKADNGRMLGNRLAAKYSTTVTKEDGTTGEGTVDWFSEFVRYSPRGVTLYKQQESLRGIGADEKGPHILEEHGHLRGDAIKLKAAKEALRGKINNAKAAIVRAVQLSQRMAFCNKYTEMSCEISREEDGSPIASNRLVFIQNTMDRTKMDIKTIGQFLAFKVKEGAKYSEIVGSSTRKPRQEVTKVDYTINSLDQYDEEVAAVATFFDKLEEQTNRKDMKVYNQLLTRLNAQGSDDLLLSMNTIMNGIEAIISKPGIQSRLAKLLGDGKKTKAA